MKFEVFGMLILAPIVAITVPLHASIWKPTSTVRKIPSLKKPATSIPVSGTLTTVISFGLKALVSSPPSSRDSPTTAAMFCGVTVIDAPVGILNFVSKSKSTFTDPSVPQGLQETPISRPPDLTSNNRRVKSCFKLIVEPSRLGRVGLPGVRGSVLILKL